MSPEGWTEREKLEALGRLSAGVAHDFNNLLQLIEVSAKELEEEMEDDHGARAELDTIVRSVDLAGSLIRSFLRVCREGHVAPETLSVKDVIVGLRPLLDRWARTGRKIVYRLSPDAAAVTIPRIHLEQIILNLFLNAHKATVEGDTITIGYSGAGSEGSDGDGGRQVRIMVSDTGSGIPDAHRSRIFEPFFTTDQSRKGSGLGLATVKELVEDAGGTISVDSSPGRGSTFHVSLPATKAPEEDRIRIESPLDHARTGSILVVEDERGTALRLQKILERVGHRVRLAGSTDVALRLIEESKVDLIISDLEVPGPPAVRIAREVQAKAAAPRFIFMSAHLREVIEAELGPGASDRILTKPLDEDEVIAAVSDELSAAARGPGIVDLVRSEGSPTSHSPAPPWPGPCPPTTDRSATTSRRASSVACRGCLRLRRSPSPTCDRRLP